MRSRLYVLGKLAALMAGVLLLAMLAANAQEAPKEKVPDKTVAAPQSMGETKKPEKKVSLSDVTPVTTEEAAHTVAKEKAQSSTQKKDDKPPEPTADSVIEFKPATRGEQSAAKSDAKPAAKRKKNIHGEAYGGLDPANSGTRQNGGAVGSTSKSGKTSVYVEGDQTRSTQTPH